MKPVHSPFDRMDLNLLRVFEAVFRERHLTRAARALSVTPSAVSHALRRLRDHLDDPLFGREGARMVPTAMCERAAPALLEQLSRLRSLLDQWGRFEPCGDRTRSGAHRPSSSTGPPATSSCRRGRPAPCSRTWRSPSTGSSAASPFAAAATRRPSPRRAIRRPADGRRPHRARRRTRARGREAAVARASPVRKAAHVLARQLRGGSQQRMAPQPAPPVSVRSVPARSSISSSPTRINEPVSRGTALLGERRRDSSRTIAGTPDGTRASRRSRA
jgi:hypothetical protein